MSEDPEPIQGEGAAERSTIVERLRAVAAAAAGLVGADRLDILQDVVREELRPVVPFDAFTFGLYDPATGLLHFEAGSDRGQRLAPHVMPLAGTPSEEVVRSRRSLLTNRSTDPRAEGATLAGTGGRSESVIRTPILTPDAVLGVMSVQSYTPGRYDAEDVELVEIVAALAATAILNIRHLEERRSAEAALRRAQERSQQLATRLRIAADMASGLIQTKSLEALQSVTRDACAQVLPLDYCTLGLFDPDTDTLRYELSLDAGLPVQAPQVVQLQGTPAETVVREKRSVLTRRASDPAGQGAAIVGTGRRSESVIRTPVLAGDRVLGVLSVQSYTPDAYDPQDVEVLEALAALAASAILNLEYLAHHRQLEAQLRQSQKMEAIGQLAGGVAHDFNNLLTVIRGNTTLVLSELKEKDQFRPELEEVDDAAQRAARLTRQLLAFGRRQVLVPETLSLNREIEQLRGLLQRLLPENTRLELRLDPRLGTVVADRSQIGQALLDLVVNARDAMPDGGVIEVVTRGHDVHGGALPTSPLEPGRYVVLEVRDQGVGMDERTLGRAFEPFFSTKTAGSATGLGLATVYGIVQQSGGHIEVDSAPGQGSTFTIFLPGHAGTPEPAEPDPPPGPRLRGTETILVVEDEPAVRQLACRVLERSGYTVLEAGDGEEALELLTRLQVQVDLLLTDLMMPRMGGPRLASRLREERPSLSVLFMSGYAGDTLEGDDAIADPDSFLPKPFTPRSLTEAVRAALDRARR